MHLGHMIPFIFSKYCLIVVNIFFSLIFILIPRWLMDVFGVSLVIQLTGFYSLILDDDRF